MRALILCCFLLQAYAFAQEHSSVADSTVKQEWAIEFTPPLLSLDFLVGGEWVPEGVYGIGVWATGGIGRGKGFLTGIRQNVEALSLGTTWHPSRNLNGWALYTTYRYLSLESEAQDANKVKYAYNMEGQYITMGYLDRGQWWKHFGYFWHVGLGIPIGDVDFRWDSVVMMENAGTVARITRIVSCLDLGLSLEWIL